MGHATMTRISAGQLGRVDLAPRALVRRSIAEFTHNLGVEFERDTDDLDGFHAAWFKFGALTFGFMHYDGEPTETTTIYLDRSLTQDCAHKAIVKIMRKFDIPARDLVWEETVPLEPLHA